MLSNVSKKLACLMFAGVMLGVAVAEAGTIPTNNVPLYTYATKKIYCYTSPGGARKGYIDPGDDIKITKVQSNGWVYGNYPTSSGRVSRWFKASDLLADRAANYTKYAPKATTTVYRDSSFRSSMGSVNNHEALIVVGGIGNSRQIIYKLSNGKGYKMGWIQSNKIIDKPTPEPTPTNTINKLIAAVYKNSSGRLTCDFDGYKELRQKHGWRHEGIDLSWYHKAPVYAAVSGYITKKGGDAYNTFAIYDSKNNKTVVYLHMNSVASGLKNGAWINKGTLIGYQGSKGADASHVHIEVRNGKSYSAAKSKNTVLDNSNPYGYWNKVL